VAVTYHQSKVTVAVKLLKEQKMHHKTGRFDVHPDDEDETFDETDEAGEESLSLEADCS
jgi:hypothetical protein